MKKIAIFVTAFIIAICVCAQNNATKKHEVQSGETLSSIARTYGVSTKELLKLNPQINPDFIMAGQRLNVPANAKAQQTTSVQESNAVPVVPVTPVQPVETANKPVAQTPVTPVQGTKTTTAVQQNRPKFKTTHEVQKKETIYSISHLYGVTEDQLISANPQLMTGKLKKGTILNIPYTEEENRKYEEEQRRIEEEARKPKVTKYSTIRAAVILPFSLSNEQMTPESQKMANLYQGFLLAVDSLKGRGYSVDVYAYDEASEEIDALLNKPMMKNMQLIVGPVRQNHVSPVSKFAHENGITHVVPLSNDLSLVNERPTTYQVNVSNSILYPQVFNRFIVLHRNDNIIFVSMNDKGDNTSFILDFKKALDDEKIIYGRATIAEPNGIKDLLKSDVRNVIIPSSGSAAAFTALCTKIGKMNLPDGMKVQFFGHPEWQALPSKHAANLAKYNCQFYTSFYSQTSSQRTQAFNAKFAQWFKQGQYNSFPHYGELGFDIGAYFLRGLRDYGSAMSENIHNINYHSLEFPFNFEKKNSWSGYQNKTVLIVTHNLDGRIFVR